MALQKAPPVIILVFAILALFPMLASGAQNSVRSRKTARKDSEQRVLQGHSPQKPLPRDLYIDKSTGRAYLKVPGRGTDGIISDTLDLFGFEAYGTGDRRLQENVDDDAHQDGRNLQRVKDTTPPAISDVQPTNGSNVTSTLEIRATVTDNVGVKSVTAQLVNTVTTASSQFSLSSIGGNVWSTTIQTTQAATFRMTITASDTSRNTATSAAATFAVSSPGGGGTGGTVAGAQWTNRAAPIARAAGRIMFEMPGPTAGTWATYVCSGTLVQLPSSTSTVDRSIVMTAAHCVYDDVNKVFARNVLFIPHQDDGGKDKSDRNCTNDALGCLPIDFGFVSDEWASRTFPNNMGVDYGFYVSKSIVTDVQNKTIGVNGDILPMLANFGTVTQGNTTVAMGYSYSDDPKFMYSSEALGFQNSGLVPNYWLPSSTLTGGSSGGPWTQADPNTAGVPVGIIATNSWGYTSQPGMASSPCNTGGAACVYNAAVASELTSITGNGVVINCNI